jgi:hypothetical protein
MYNTSNIAELLDTDRRNINYYIRQGHLKATMIDGDYKITQKDYFSFREEYYDTDKRHSNRGIAKKLTDTQVLLIGAISKDTQNNNISFEKFKNKYECKKDLIPQIDDFIIYKRDRCIRYDNASKGYRYAQLSDIYNLAEITIRGIVNEIQNKENFF